MFIGQYAADLSEQFNPTDLVVDKSLFKARGPVSDRPQSRCLSTNLDTDATWSKSGYHGWIYGYGLHIICTQDAFPTLITVKSASVSESWVIDHKAPEILNTFHLKHSLPMMPNPSKSYSSLGEVASRFDYPCIAMDSGTGCRGVFDLSTNLKRLCLSKRRSSVEPLFDLIAKVIGTTPQQKQLPVKGFCNVRCCLAIGVLSVQIAMIVNAIWSLPARNVSHMAAVFQ